MRVVMAGWLAPPSPLQGAAGALDGGGAGRGAERRGGAEVRFWLRFSCRA